MKEGLPKSLIALDLVNRFKELNAAPDIGFPNVKSAHLSNFSTVHQNTTTSHTRLTSPPISSTPISSLPLERAKTKTNNYSMGDDSLKYFSEDEMRFIKRLENTLNYWANKNG